MAEELKVLSFKLGKESPAPGYTLSLILPHQGGDERRSNSPCTLKGTRSTLKTPTVPVGTRRYPVS